ncbi:MAG: ATP-binding protein [Candidatus Dependentiae bacterium]
MAEQFPVVAILGPRQSGKTTLAKETFAGYAYISLEDIDTRTMVRNDPRKFFASVAQEKGIIIDEMQEVPELFSYMQGIVDEAYRPGRFIIIGSQNFLMLEKITQTLAGRIVLLTLLPLTVQELSDAKLLPSSLEELLFKGCYPRLYVQPINIQAWLSSYITTYIERDVRQIINISDVVSFGRFIKLCAARTGNLLNYAELARDAGISPNTVKSWISILEASYIIFQINPYFKNFSKRMIKSSKIYFYDTGIICSLLNIKSAHDLYTHPMRGAIFESFVISEMYKYRYNKHLKPDLYFWRDVQGHEIDAAFEKNFDTIVPIEIKSGMTFRDSFYKSLNIWKKIAGLQDEKGYVVYAGDKNMVYKENEIFAWDNIIKLMDQMENS